MGKHSVPQGETGTMTSKTGKTESYDGKHREGTAKGSSGQNQTTKHDDH
jgi:hypothetical protein